MTNMRTIVVAAAVIGTMTAAQAYDNDASWAIYYSMESSRQNTEALINEMRAARGMPPCQLGTSLIEDIFNALSSRQPPPQC